ncbi:MAG TPA: peptidoglycan synthetase, partial [Puia sp.]|nr:peptidoglycan synthetase [Puia sp.]
VKAQFPARKLIAVLELHTYSSLNEAFLAQYRGSLDDADTAVVFYSPHALELKRLPPLDENNILAGFGKKGLLVLHKKEELAELLMKETYKNVNLLLMSSGNYDGLDVQAISSQIIQ